jgi:hypothetical protein
MADGPPDQYDFDPAYEINTDSGWLQDGNGNAIMGQGVQASLPGLQGYSQNIHKIHQNFNSMSGTIIGPLADMAQGAFGTMGQGLPWATMMSHLIGHNIEQLSRFNQRISMGTNNVASAAQVVANVYGDTDAGSAATLNAVDFAFGNRAAAPDSVPQYVLDNVQTWNEFRAENPGVAASMGGGTPVGGEPVRDGNKLTTTVQIPQPGGKPITMVTVQETWSTYPGGPTGTTTTVTYNDRLQSVSTSTTVGSTTTTRVTTSYYDEDGTHLRDRVTRESTETTSVEGSRETTTQRTDTSSTTHQYDEDGDRTGSTTTEGTVAVGAEHPDRELPDPRDDPRYQERMQQLPQPG